MDSVLIDTDVLLDFFFDRKPFSEFSTEIISLCEKRKIRGFISPVICSNTYYLLRKTASHTKVIEKLSKLLTIIDVLTMDKSVVLGALNSGFSDFEDGLQYIAAVQNTTIKVILTRNISDFKKSTIAVLNPEVYLKTFYLDK